jgi:hypothetical protein
MVSFQPPRSSCRRFHTYSSHLIRKVAARWAYNQSNNRRLQNLGQFTGVIAALDTDWEPSLHRSSPARFIPNSSFLLLCHTRPFQHAPHPPYTRSPCRRTSSPTTRQAKLSRPHPSSPTGLRLRIIARLRFPISLQQEIHPPSIRLPKCPISTWPQNSPDTGSRSRQDRGMSPSLVSGSSASVGLGSSIARGRGRRRVGDLLPLLGGIAELGLLF